MELTRTSVLFWIASIFGLIGTFLNSFQHIEGFVFWAISNPILLWQAIQDKSYNMAFMFVVYFVLAINGLIQWS